MGIFLLIMMISSSHDFLEGAVGTAGLDGVAELIPCSSLTFDHDYQKDLQLYDNLRYQEEGAMVGVGTGGVTAVGNLSPVSAQVT